MPAAAAAGAPTRRNPGRRPVGTRAHERPDQPNLEQPGRPDDLLQVVVMMLADRRVGIQVVVVVRHGRDGEIVLRQQLLDEVRVPLRELRGIDLPRLVVAIGRDRPRRHFDGSESLGPRPAEEIFEAELRQACCQEAEFHD